MANKRIRKKSEKRKQTEKKFRQITEQANKILEDFEKDDIRFILDDDYGGVFSDSKIMNKKGYFRNNPTKKSIAQMENITQIMETLIEDSDAYREDAERLKNLADEMDIDKAFWEFIKFASAIVGHQVSPSDTIAVIARVRLERGESLEKVENTFYQMYMNSESDAEFIYKFSERGTLL